MVDPPSVSVQSNADNSTNNDDDTDEMEEQLEEYQEMLEDLGNHAVSRKPYLNQIYVFFLFKPIHLSTL